MPSSGIFVCRFNLNGRHCSDQLVPIEYVGDSRKLLASACCLHGGRSRWSSGPGVQHQLLSQAHLGNAQGGFEMVDPEMVAGSPDDCSCVVCGVAQRGAAVVQLSRDSPPM